MDPIEGVDYSTDHPSATGLASVGKHFAARYVGPGQSSKHLTLVEAERLAAAGLSIVANAEGYADGLLGGFDVGAQWARSAHAMATHCGMPPDRPIYLSCDFDVQVGSWLAVAAALKGAASVLGHSRVGLYGGYNAIAWAVRDGLAPWLWQTYAWSTWWLSPDGTWHRSEPPGGDAVRRVRWHPAARCHQYRNGVSLVGGTVDLDRAVVADYGQWTPGGSSGPGPGEGVDVEASEVWAYLISSPSLAMENVEARDWLKQGAVASEKIDALAGQVSQLAVAVEAQTSPTSAANLAELLREVKSLLEELARTPLIDAVAVAAALAANHDVMDALSAGVAERLAAIDGEITMTGTLGAHIRPPTPT